MKYLFLSVTFLILRSAGAQKDLEAITGHDFYDQIVFAPQNSLKPNEFIKKNKISSQKTIRIVGKFTSTEIKRYNQNGDILSREYTSSDGHHNTEIITYNSEGRVSSKKTWNKKEELVKNMEYTYDSKGRTTSISESYGKVHSVLRFSYDQNGNKISESRIDAKGKIYLRKKKYDLITNQILTNELYRQDTLNPLKRLEYSYYEDGSKKSIHYFEKEKLVYTWNFDCAPEGQIVNLKKSDSTLVCIKKEKDAAGNEIVWRHEFNSSGVPVKIKTVYNSNGKITEEVSYRADGTIRNQKTFFEDGGYLDLYFDKKGRPDSSMESFYNTNGQMIKFSRIYSKKHFNHTWYSYNPQGLISLETHMSQRSTIIQEHYYTFFE